MRVIVWFQFFRFVRMIVRAVFPLVLVLMFLSVTCMGMLVRVLVLMFVFVHVVVLVSVRRLVVGVLVCMSMSVFVLVLVAMIVLTFHRISSLFQHKDSSLRYSLKTSGENRRRLRVPAPDSTDNSGDRGGFPPW